MAGSTSSTFNTVVDSVITRLATATTIGVASSNIYERDESPAIPANEGRLPAIYVIPLVEGKDVIDMTMGFPEVGFHSFPINIVAYYEMPDVSGSLRTVRNYAYNAYDVFLNGWQSLGYGEITGMTVEVGYNVVVDKIIHYWILVLNIKSLF